ncbi:MAG: hypothetical protein AMJ81_09245 [Phycisphaerae bacterium SM23_33]|jgi:hypothetical protein|nr:MAG: hypothetical protein AMJ81_09245 [Phycisphaerae bacterium SM23_33]
MTLDELLEKVPEKWRPVAAEYGPALLAMTAEELWAWIHLLLNGKEDQAYQALLAKLDNPDLLAEWTRLNDCWQAANQANAERVALQKKALFALLQVLLTVALATVGL